MAHHSSDHPFGPGGPKNQEAFEKLRKALEPAELEVMKKTALGPTDRHPEPRLGPHDEGEIKFAVGTLRDDAGIEKVVLDFGTPVHSLGLTKQQAVDMANLLCKAAGIKIHLRYG